MQLVAVLLSAFVPQTHPHSHHSSATLCFLFCIAGGSLGFGCWVGLVMSGELKSGHWGNQDVSSHFPLFSEVSWAVVATLLWLWFLVTSDHWLKYIYLLLSSPAQAWCW